MAHEPTAEDWARFDLETQRLIAEHGWQQTGVFPRADGKGPHIEAEFSYTTGFYETWGHPEVLLIGLPAQAASTLLWTMARRIKDGERFEGDGTEYAGIIQEPYTVRFRTIPQSAYRGLLSVAMVHYGGDGFPAIQMVLPDVDGRWPEDEDYDPKMRRLHTGEAIGADLEAEF